MQIKTSQRRAVIFVFASGKVNMISNIMTKTLQQNLQDRVTNKQ
jgi:hypothetical protein